MSKNLLPLEPLPSKLHDYGNAKKRINISFVLLNLPQRKKALSLHNLSLTINGLCPICNNLANNPFVKNRTLLFAERSKRDIFLKGSRSKRSYDCLLLENQTPQALNQEYSWICTITLLVQVFRQQKN